MNTPEQLTEEERMWLESDPEFQKWDVRRKTLRIIDAHAADRAALVARVAELEREIERLTCLACDADKRVAESEVARLREALEAVRRALALLGRIPDCLLTDCPVYADLMARLSVPPAAPAEHDQDEPTCRAATHGRRNSNCTCEDARDE